MPFPFDQEKTQQNVSDFVNFQLLECGFENADVEKVIYVTDEGSNMQGFRININFNYIIKFNF